jgi:hypothetical protein
MDIARSKGFPAIAKAVHFPPPLLVFFTNKLPAGTLYRSLLVDVRQKIPIRAGVEC